jgi:hypothetical protein
LQTVGTVAKVEVGSDNADLVGAYSLTLPTSAPLLAPFSSTLPLAFTAQSANAAKYTLEAAADGYATQTAAIDLGPANATANFTLSPAP